MWYRHSFFNETKTYLEKHNFYNDDGTLHHLKLGEHMLTLDLIIRGYTDDGDELILFPKELEETDLVLLILWPFFNYFIFIFFSLIRTVIILFELFVFH